MTWKKTEKCVKFNTNKDYKHNLSFLTFSYIKKAVIYKRPIFLHTTKT